MYSTKGIKARKPFPLNDIEIERERVCVCVRSYGRDYLSQIVVFNCSHDRQ